MYFLFFSWFCFKNHFFQSHHYIFIFIFIFYLFYFLFSFRFLLNFFEPKNSLMISWITGKASIASHFCEFDTHNHYVFAAVSRKSKYHDTHSDFKIHISMHSFPSIKFLASLLGRKRLFHDFVNIFFSISVCT